jgi:hypothetical protein
MKRCQEKNADGELCRLPIAHRCTHLYLGDPLSLLQAQHWAEEIEKQSTLGYAVLSRICMLERELDKSLKEKQDGELVVRNARSRIATLHRAIAEFIGIGWSG